MSLSLNIVAFDVPFPANYGGVIDVYYKLHWLKKAGVNIHLHCFAYGRKPAPQLEDLCASVSYYERKTGLISNLSFLPYTVKSRRSAELEKNLLANNFPVLFEVLTTCYLLNDLRFKTRKKIYRHSNIEHEYYAELSRSERGFFKKIFLKVEAWKLKRFEPILKFADLILAVNQKDTAYFKQKYARVPSVYLPSFHPNVAVTARPGKSDYVLFHGNLSVSENYEAAVWLTQHVFSKINHKVIIAGLNPPAFLAAFLKSFSNIELRISPSENEMDQLVQNAQVHALYTAQPTGLKLKLLNVLFKGRFVICNSHLLSGTGLAENSSLLIADTADAFVKHINQIMPDTFSGNMISERVTLVSHFDNVANAEKLIEAVFEL